MKLAWPITTLASVVAFGLFTFVTIMEQLQSVPTGPALTWPALAMAHAPFILVGTLVVGLVAWIVERNIRRSRAAG